MIAKDFKFSSSLIEVFSFMSSSIFKTYDFFSLKFVNINTFLPNTIAEP